MTAYRVQVPGDELVSTCRGDESAWIVDVTTSINTTRHWIGKENGQLIGVKVDVGNGAAFEQALVCG